MAQTSHRTLCLAALAISTVAGAAGDVDRPPVRDLTRRVNEVAGQIKNAEDNLKLVEAEYSQRALTNDESLARRFSAAEIQFLLNDFATASVLFYDLISDNDFQKNPSYPDALLYLAESLYRQQNLTSAKLYLRQLLALGGRRSNEALARFVEISGRLNEFSGIDEYVAQVRAQNGQLPPEISYVYAKSMFRRVEIPLEKRLETARSYLLPLWENTSSPLRLQSGYLLAVAQIQLGNLDSAIEQFQKMLPHQPRDPREIKVKELTSLSLGRLLYEVGRYDEAVDAYQAVPLASEYYVDSLYETAWCYVRKGDFDRAKKATEILELVAQGSTVEPDATILHAHLLLKLKQYDQAGETYRSVISTYTPVRNEIDNLLSSKKDPVTYFDNLLARSEKHFEATSLLPPMAVKWATTGPEVAQALRIVSDLDTGRKTAVDSERIAKDLLQALDQRALEVFPTLQEGYARAEAIDSALTQADQNLVRVEEQLVSVELTPQARQQLEDFRRQKAELEKQFSLLPTTPAEVDARRKRLRDRVDAADRDAFKLGYELQSMRAVITAIEKWLFDTRAENPAPPENQRDFSGKLQAESGEVTALHQQLEEVRRALAKQKGTADLSLSGEDQIRKEYAELLRQEHSLLEPAEAKLPADYRGVINLAHEMRGRANELKLRTVEAKRALRRRVADRAEQIRNKVTTELALLSGYRADVSQVSQNASNLVGRIAFESFKRVRQQFHDLVLKADVGLVDIAFTRKQDESGEIQKLATQKDKDLRALDNEFKDVLKEEN